MADNFNILDTPTPPTKAQLTALGVMIPTVPIGLGLEASGAITTADTGEGTFRAAPVFVPVTSTWDRISCEVAVVGSAGSLIRLGIYADDGSGLPGALILDAGTEDGTVLGAHHKVISQALTPGWYWVGAAIQGAAVTRPVMRSIQGPYTLTGVTTGLGSANFQRTAVVGSVTGALPNPSGATTGLTGNCPRLVLRRSA